jgi:hypothetical protein
MTVKSFNLLVSWEYCTMSPDNLTECYPACKDSGSVLTKRTSKKEYDDLWRVGGWMSDVSHALVDEWFRHARKPNEGSEVGESEIIRIEGHK